MGLRAIWPQRVRRAEPATMTKERGTRSQVVAGATRADRVRARDLLGPLGSLRVAGITRGRYCRAYRNFAWYMYVCGWVLRFLDEVDVALSAYVTTLYEEGEVRQKANEAAAALQHLPRRPSVRLIGDAGRKPPGETSEPTAQGQAR